MNELEPGQHNVCFTCPGRQRDRNGRNYCNPSLVTKPPFHCPRGDIDFSPTKENNSEPNPYERLKAQLHGGKSRRKIF